MTMLDHTPVRMRVLLVDADEAARDALAAGLRPFGAEVTATPDGAAMAAAAGASCWDLLLLDPWLRGDDGWRRLRELRACSSLPVIVVQRDSGPTERVLALEMGADAVLDKPCDPRELALRMRALLERVRPEAPEGTLRFGRWALDAPRRRLVGPGGVSVPLSIAEHRLLGAFLKHPRCVLRRDELMTLARGDGVEQLDRSIDLLVSRLRAKLDDDARSPSLIRTVRGVGYLFDAFGL